MSSKDETESPDIIEEIIPGKNNDYNDKSINQNNNNNQQPFIENYNEQESAQAVIEASEESKKSIERNVDKAGNQFLVMLKQSLKPRNKQPKQQEK